MFVRVPHVTSADAASAVLRACVVLPFVLISPGSVDVGVVIHCEIRRSVDMSRVSVVEYLCLFFNYGTWFRGYLLVIYS